MVLYDSKVPNHPIVDGKRVLPPATSKSERLRVRVDELEMQVLELESCVVALRERNAALQQALAAQARRAHVKGALAALRQERRAREEALQQDLLNRLIWIVARHASIAPAALRGARRGRTESWPRQMLCYLARERCHGLSLPQIGMAVDKDHTTILHATRVVKVRMKAKCPRTVALFEACRAEVQEAVRLHKRAAQELARAPVSASASASAPAVRGDATQALVGVALAQGEGHGQG